MSVAATYTFITACNDESILRSSLLASPDLSSAAEVVVQRGAESAAKAYNAAIDSAKGGILVFLHQDVYLPCGWLQRLSKLLEVLGATDRNWGVLGLYGTDSNGIGHGLVHSAGMAQTYGSDFAGVKPVETLDEVMLIIRRESGLNFDETVGGYHLYGADLCLRARQRGMKSYAMSLLCLHNSGGMRILPCAYWKCYLKMRRKWWRMLPVMTPCMPITRGGGPAIRYLIKASIRLALNRKTIGGRAADPRKLLEAVDQVSLEKQGRSVRSPAAHASHQLTS